MAITLNELMKLREDKQTFARIEQLIEQRAKANKAIEAARLDLAGAEKELAALGIAVDGSPVKLTKSGVPAMKRGPKPGAKRGRKPGRPAGSGAARASSGGAGGRMSADDYQKALDDIGQEMNKADVADIKGPDIVSAMARRGFKSKQVVMIQLRKNKSWKMTGVKRAARYHYKGK
ncbi:MAG: hypothetical protein JNL94_18745 [Planctomycetes bacterium]|nr:hypothetical protein [Planctomycetota bacterium]